MRDLINKIVLVDSNEGNTESARVTVIMKNGETYSAFVENAKGYPKNPLYLDELLDKLWVNVEFGENISKNKANQFLSPIENIEQLENTAKLVAELIH